jgi:hypothetical protein
MALYTRMWAASTFTPRPVAHQQTSALTLQAALELINMTCTPTHSEIKLAYSLWESQLHSNSVTNKTPLYHQASA